MQLQIPQATLKNLENKCLTLRSISPKIGRGDETREYSIG